MDSGWSFLCAAHAFDRVACVVVEVNPITSDNTIDEITSQTIQVEPVKAYNNVNGMTIHGGFYRKAVDWLSSE